MKILILSDIHSKTDRIYEYLDENSFDNIIITGDVTEFGPEELFVEILDKLSTYAPVYAIKGNCDPTNADELIEKSSATNVDGKCVNLDKIQLVRFGGSNPTPFDTPNEFSEEIIYDSLNKFNEQLSDKNKYTILMTHAPAYDTKTDTIESGAHVGSTSVHKIIEQTQPTLNLCGHVHESKAIDKLENTTLVNPGNAAENHAAILTITDDDIKNKNVNIQLITL